MADGEDELVWSLIAALATAGAFLLLSALLLWPAGAAALVGPLAAGLGALLVATLVSILPMRAIQRLFRLDIDDTFDAYLAVNLLLSLALTGAWVAFAGGQIAPAAAGAAPWAKAILHVLGALSCYVAASIVTIVYSGSLYRLACMTLGPLGYAGYAAWLAFAA